MSQDKPKKTMTYSESALVALVARTHEVAKSKVSIERTREVDEGPRGFSPATISITVDLTE